MFFRRARAQLKTSIVSANTVLHFEDIPSPKGLPIIGTTLSIIAQGSTPKLHKYVDRRHKQLGPIYKERVGPVSCVFLADPEEIRNVFAQEGKYPMHVLPEAWIAYNQLYGCPRGLFFMDGSNWLHHRKIMNGLLLKGDLKWIESACDCASDKLIQHLYKTKNSVCENLEGVLYQWSLHVIVSTLLGAQTYEKNSEFLEEDIAKLADTVRWVFETTAKLALIPASIASKYKIPRWNRFVKSVDDALHEAQSLVSKLTQVLTPESNGLLPKLLNEDITKEDIKRIIVDLILAAGDTTAVAMEWMLYLIAKNRDTQQELRENKDLIRLVFKETLRLYPVAPFLTRILPEDSILCGYSVPKHTLIILSIYTTGRDERYFKNPNDFHPKRWDRNYNKDYTPEMQKASLPFAMGMRACIGRIIAEKQLQMGLLKIVNNFDVQLCNKKDIDIVLKMVTVPSEPLRLKFQAL